MSAPSPKPRLIGYARVSTDRQDLAYQLERLKAAGCNPIFQEKRSGKNVDERPELHKILATMRQGDKLLATLGDRVSRDPFDMMLIVRTLRKAGAVLQLLDENFTDTASEKDDYYIVFKSFTSRSQRFSILMNTAVGRERARQRGVKFGRKPVLGPKERAIIADKRANGEPCAKIARGLGVSESTVWRAVTANNDEPPAGELC